MTQFREFIYKVLFYIILGLMYIRVRIFKYTPKI
jgi:hypothetical protein